MNGTETTTQERPVGQWLSQLLCRLGGHVWVRKFDRDKAGRILRQRCECSCCGALSPGWSMGVEVNAMKGQQ